MAAMIRRADLVVRGRVTSLGTPEKLAGSSSPLAVRYHQIEVLEILKSTAQISVAHQIRIAQFGGTVISGQQEAQTNYQGARFRNATEWVFFLRRFPAGGDGAFALVSASVGLFEVNADGRSAVVPRAAKNMPEVVGLASLSLDDIRSAVRNASGRQQ